MFWTLGILLCYSSFLFSVVVLILFGSVPVTAQGASGCVSSFFFLELYIGTDFIRGWVLGWGGLGDVTVRCHGSHWLSHRLFVLGLWLLGGIVLFLEVVVLAVCGFLCSCS